MEKILIIVDMQKDFVDGSLGTKEAQAIVPAVKEKIENFNGDIIFTKDTHGEDYMNTQEGQNLPVPHCIRGTDGWQIRKELDVLRKTEPIDKETFGSTDLAGELVTINEDEEISVKDGFIWVSLGQIKELLRYPNVVNMDSRTVISCIKFGNYSEQSLKLLSSVA